MGHIESTDGGRKRLGFAALFMLLAGLASTALAVQITGDGAVPRGTQAHTMTVNLTFTSLSKDQLPEQVGSEVDAVKAHVKVSIPALATEDKAIRFEDVNPSDQYVENYYATVSSAEITQDTATELYTLKTTLEINDGGHPKSIGDLASGGTVTIKVSYLVSGTAVGDAKDISITQMTGVANDIPPNFTVVPQHKGLAATWDKKDRITYNQGGDQPPTGVSVFIIPMEIGKTSLTGVEFASEGTEKASPCSFEATSETSCRVTCDANVYLDATGIASSRTDIFVEQVDAAHNTAAKSGLDPDKSYAVFAMYQPDGIVRTDCKVAKPTLNQDLTELNGGPAAKPGNPTCFIATAAYGTPFHRHLDLLRWFRDTYLLPSPAGRTFVETYYRLSPPVASFIADHDALRALTRGILWGPVLVIAGIKSFPHLTLLCLVFATGMIFSVVVLLWRRRRLAP